MNDRDEEILRLVARYGMMIQNILQNLLFTGLTAKAVERVITRLLQQGLLRSQPLFGRQCCYTLTPAGARLLGLDEKRFARPLGTIALIKRFAILKFCLSSSVRHHKMTPAEFRERFRTLAVPGMNHDRYYLDEHARLSLLVADHGADWRRLCRKVRHEVGRRQRLDAWKPFVSNKLFAVTVLAASPEKARALSKALAKESYPVHVAVVPELVNFLHQGTN